MHMDIHIVSGISGKELNLWYAGPVAEIGALAWLD
jgi:hypothetical protein